MLAMFAAPSWAHQNTKWFGSDTMDLPAKH